MAYACLVCERHLRRSQYGLCLDCKRQLGLVGVPQSDWPTDLKEMRVEAQRFDRDPLGDSEIESLDALLEVGVQFDTEGNVYYPSNWVPELRDEDLLQLAPYETYEENAEYWRANNLEPTPEARAMVRAEAGERAPRDPEKRKPSSEVQAVLDRAYARAHKTKRTGPLDTDHETWRDRPWRG